MILLFLFQKSNEIDFLLTKKERYNMRRQTKQCEEICGNLSFTDYVIGEAPEKNIFKFKFFGIIKMFHMALIMR